jgi:hypothetical protein
LAQGGSMGHHLFRGGFSIDQRCARHGNSVLRFDGPSSAESRSGRTAKEGRVGSRPSSTWTGGSRTVLFGEVFTFGIELDFYRLIRGSPTG